jgi:AraC-like DNA-binding protein
MSRRGIHQAFMKHLGVPPGEVLRQMRIQRAKELLTRFDYKMKVVAARAGYRSLNTFGVAFKNATGLSPKQFQGQWRSGLDSTRRNTGALSTGVRDGLSTNLPERFYQHGQLISQNQE